MCKLKIILNNGNNYYNIVHNIAVIEIWCVYLCNRKLVPRFTWAIQRSNVNYFFMK